MKKSLLFILLLAFSAYYGNVFSENKINHTTTREIELSGILGGNPLRSPLPEKDVVEAYIDNNKITIYFNLPCKDETVAVFVRNENGQVVAEETYTMNTPNVISLYIEYDEEGAYTIEIAGPNGRLTGEF